MTEINFGELHEASESLQKVLVKWGNYIKHLETIPVEKQTLRDKETLRLWRVTNEGSGE